MFKSFIIALSLCAVFVMCHRTQQSKYKLVIDNDAGGDDAMAIFLALLYEKHFNGPKLVALTTGHGNTAEENVYINNQRILKVAKRQDVPIYRGAKSSLIKSPETNAYYGEDGLGNTNEYFDDLVAAQPENAVRALINLSKEYEGELVVVTIGTLTNVAMAIKLDPEFLTRVKYLYVAAGHIQNEIHSSAEFNAYMDAEAYHIIAQHATPDKVTVFPFSQTIDSLDIPIKWRLDVLGEIQSDIMIAQNKFESVSMAKNTIWYALDPSAVAVVLRPELVEEYKYYKNDIILCGEERGKNTNTAVSKTEANVRLVYSVKKEDYQQFLLDVFSKDVK